MPSLRRVLILCGDDLAYAVTGLKGWVFLLPFFLFWFWVLDKLQRGVAAWLQDPEGLALAAWILNPDLAHALFKIHPPTLSAYYLIALYTLPVFAVLGSCNQMARDAGRGYFRLVLSRCTRPEIVLGRSSSAYVLMAAGWVIVGLATAIVSLQADARPIEEVIAYAIHIHLLLLLYLATWVVLMTLLSVTFNSAAAVLLSVPLLWWAVKAAAFVLPWPVGERLAYLLPNRLTGFLLDPEGRFELRAILAMPLYVLTYGALAVYRFRRRDL